MTVVQPNSIAGINSITVLSGDSLSIHKSDGSLIREIVSAAGIATYDGIKVASGGTVTSAGNAAFAGIVTANGGLVVKDVINLPTSGDFAVGISTFFVDHSAGEVGIGTVNPQDVLDVAAAVPQIRLTDLSDGSYGQVRANGGNLILRADEGNDVGSSVIIFEIDGSEKIRIDDSGRLLINKDASTGAGWGNQNQVQLEGTDNVTSSLAIKRNSNNNGGPYLYLGKSRGSSIDSDTIVQDGDEVGSIVYHATDGTDANNICARIIGAVDGTPGSNDMPGRLMFATTADGAGDSTERMRITNAGLVGIGTITPDVLLHLGGESGAAQLKMQRTNAASNGNDYGRIYWESHSGTLTGQISVARASAETDGYMIFKTASSGTLSERIRIEAGGNVGIGTDDPGETLEVGLGGDIKLKTGVSAATTKRIYALGGTGSYSVGSSGGSAVAFVRDASNNDAIAFETHVQGSSHAERVRIDSSGRLIVGHTATDDRDGYNSSLQVSGTSGDDSSASIGRWSGDASAPGFILSKSRNGTIGSHTVVQANDILGLIQFQGDDGSNYHTGASIQAKVESGVGNDDIPTSLIFGTNAGGTGTTTALTIDSSQNATFAGSVTDSKGELRTLTVNAQGSDYTLVVGDAGKFIRRTGGNVTIPDDIFSTGNMVTILNDAGSSMTITAGTGFSLYNTADAATGNRTLAARGMATILFNSTEQGYISGAGLS